MVSYRILDQKNLTYGVEVREPDTAPQIVTGFQSIAEAEHWIEIRRRSEGLGGQHSKDVSE